MIYTEFQKLEEKKWTSKSWEVYEFCFFIRNITTLSSNNSKHDQEELEKKKSEYGEKMRNKIAEVHKQAEEKKAMIETRRGEEFLKAEEMSAKYRATGHVPKKVLGCFGG